MHTQWKFVLIVMIMIHSVGNACSSGEKRVRMPAVAGAFYPADADTLRETVVSFLSEASSAEAGKCRRSSFLMPVMCIRAALRLKP